MLLAQEPDRVVKAESGQTTFFPPVPHGCIGAEEGRGSYAAAPVFVVVVGKKKAMRILPNQIRPRATMSHKVLCLVL